MRRGTTMIASATYGARVLILKYFDHSLLVAVTLIAQILSHNIHIHNCFQLKIDLHKTSCVAEAYIDSSFQLVDLVVLHFIRA